MADQAEDLTGILRQIGADKECTVDQVSSAVPKFVQIDSYTTFMAEYSPVRNDLIFHFFPPREAYVVGPGAAPRVLMDFLPKWKRTFPEILSPVAEGYFGATRPVLEAQYVTEMSSWWLRAGGFANRLDPEGFALAFLEKLDAALDARGFRV